ASHSSPTLFPYPTLFRSRMLIFIAVSLFNVGLLALLASQLLVPAQNQSGSTSDNSPLIGHSAPDFTLAVLSAHPAPTVHLASFRSEEHTSELQSRVDLVC